MDYDVVILGGGIIGCAAAYELSKYSLNIAVIEKNYDIADDVALVNTDIIYDGIECDDTLVSKLELMGNGMFEELCERLDVPFNRSGGLIIAGTEEEEKRIIQMYDKAINKGIKNLRVLDSEKVYEMEPNLNVKVRKAIYSENMGVICPYDLAIAYGEVAFDNGVNFKLEEEVVEIVKLSKGFRVETNKNKFTCKMVINTTYKGQYGIDNETFESVDNNGGDVNYFLLDKGFKGMFSNVLFNIGEKGDITYAVPAVHGNTVAALNTRENLDFNNSLQKVSGLVNGIKVENIVNYYQTTLHDNTVLIDDSSVDKGYIKVIAKHYGEVTMTPAIAIIICETVISNTKCKLRRDFNDKRREFFRFRYMSNEERAKVIKVDSKYGKMICRCQKVTEGEIVDAIRRPLGARTVEGIKRRTGATFGSCQGSYCLNKIVSILARETNKNVIDIVKDSKSSRVVPNRIKEFDGV
ncbi:NAD(P)/FAD-dependent oxidoreductase [Clostridium omnivorum]|uniref:FAD/NAD(P)-binding oxidoreductase n=1 Tax=Clostridium omnivorum TaxID=1604902 RepID=A0ABQ5N5K3_9CLOT|nr:FAD-dependent oxidoreductase [Clostridium sp. E14]GLC30491.1 FAD/NAD(P)-binding oxidoreductase [Clostridium sp. E14]